MNAMRAGVRILAAALIAAPVSAADPPGFSIWTAGDLAAHDAALSTHVAADHSSRETLADFGSHRFRMLYRDADGNPEQHDAIIDVVVVQSGTIGVLAGSGGLTADPFSNHGARPRPHSAPR